MKTTERTAFKITTALLLAGGLAACGGGNGDGDVVRQGPQAVHPSPSALAQRGDATPAATNQCGHDGHNTCHSGTARDGSAPIID